MDLIMTSWQPSDLTEGGEVFVPANFGIMGGAIYNQWTPTHNPRPDEDPRIAQWNKLGQFPAQRKVTDLAQFQALNQAGLVQLSQLKPATFIPPGTASVTPGGLT